jgi:hypothetical protein
MDAATGQLMPPIAPMEAMVINSDVKNQVVVL